MPLLYLTCLALCFQKGGNLFPGWHQTLLPRVHEVMPHADGPGPGNQATPWNTLRPQALGTGKRHRHPRDGAFMALEDLALESLQSLKLSFW